MNRLNERLILRKILSLATVALVVISLAGCASGSQVDQINALTPTCKPYTSGKALDSLKDSASKGGVPMVTITGGVDAAEIQTKVISEGSGPKIVGNQMLKVEYQGINGGTGKAFQSSKFDGSDAAQLYVHKGGKPDFCHALSGVHVGSRVAVLFPAQIAHAGAGIPSYGIGAKDSIIYVFDILSASLPHALGAAGTLKSGFPAISFDPTTGAPGYTWSKSSAPTKLTTEKLIVGNGTKVKAGDTVTLNYSGIVYNGTATFDSSWDKKQPAQFQLMKGALIDGFYQTLVGSHVGDRIVAIIPPNLAYGPQGSGSIPANSTLVFVIDVLGTGK
jgi:peptidylprolyl isomerase